MNLDTVNDVTKTALEEGRKLVYDKGTTGYTDIEELKIALEIDNKED